MAMRTRRETGCEDWERFESLVGRHRTYLTRYANRLSGNGNDAEDLVQETLLQAYRHRHTLRESSSIVAWLSVTLKNTFINQLRQRRRHFAVLPLDHTALLDLPDPAHHDVAHLVIRRGEHTAILNAIAALPEWYRAPLLLADRDGLSYVEIAEALHVPTGTVRSRISRARARLRRSLFVWRRKPHV